MGKDRVVDKGNTLAWKQGNGKYVAKAWEKAKGRRNEPVWGRRSSGHRGAEEGNKGKSKEEIREYEGTSSRGGGGEGSNANAPKGEKAPKAKRMGGVLGI